MKCLLESEVGFDFFFIKPLCFWPSKLLVLWFSLLFFTADLHLLSSRSFWLLDSEVILLELLTTMSVLPSFESLDYPDSVLRAAWLMCCLTVINRNLIVVAFFLLHFSHSGKTSRGAVPWLGRVTQCHSVSTTALPARLLSYQCASLESISLQPVSGRTLSPPEWHSWDFWWHAVKEQRGTKRESWKPL